jgi:hypothetical protein
MKISMRPPRYVKFKAKGKYAHPCCLIFEAGERHNTYYRVAGAWGVRFKIIGEQIFIDAPSGAASHLNGMELIKCSKKEWEDDNAGYI